MKKYYLSLITLMTPFLFFAQKTTSEKIDETFKEYTGWFVDGIFYEIPFSEYYQIPWVLIVLIGGALFFTILRSFFPIQLNGNILILLTLVNGFTIRLLLLRNI